MKQNKTNTHKKIPIFLIEASCYRCRILLPPGWLSCTFHLVLGEAFHFSVPVLEALIYKKLLYIKDEAREVFVGWTREEAKKHFNEVLVELH